MHYGASGKIILTAQKLRARQTPEELRLWELLCTFFPKVKFRRQHPIDVYVVDFYCHQAKLVIELDGGYHLKYEVAENDAARAVEIEALGIKILRFKNEDLENDADQVIESIRNILTQSSTL